MGSWREGGGGAPPRKRFSLELGVCLPTGLLCHLDDACISNPCNEGSNCDTNPVTGKAICTCPPGYTGPACNQDVDECGLGKLPPWGTRSGGRARILRFFGGKLVECPDWSRRRQVGGSRS